MPWLGLPLEKWRSYKTVLGNHHVANFILILLVVLRSPVLLLSQRVLLSAAAFANATAWWCCTWGGSAEGAHSRRVAFWCGLAAWAFRTVVIYRWSQGVPFTPVIERAFSSTYVFVSETFVCIIEQVQALMYLPTSVVIAGMAVHLYIAYAAIKLAQGQPNVLSTIIWVLAELMLPHLVHYFMYKGCRVMAAVRAPSTHKAAAAACSDKAASPSKKGLITQAPAGGEVPQCPKDNLKGYPKPASAPHVPSGKTAESFTSTSPPLQPSLESMPGAASGAEALRGGGPSKAGKQLQVLSPAHSVTPTAEALKALHNARALVQRGCAKAGYTSRLLQPQVVVIKLKDTEPEQLRQDMITAVNKAMNQGLQPMTIARACARKGCTLLTFDLVAAAGNLAQGGKSDLATYEKSDLPMQAWLNSLLSPGTVIPDGAVAHISLGSRQYQAIWWEDGSTWIVEEVDRRQAAAAAGAVSVDLSVLFVDRPVARLLPPQKTLTTAATAAGSTGSVHRTSLLLRHTQPGANPDFIGSDQTSAPPDQPSTGDGGPVSVQCVARGCWGTCLPVAVAGREEGRDAEGSLNALTLDVDLSQAPSAGSVQLELWCGRALLASAPLLLLPELSSLGFSDGDITDAVLEELQSHAAASDATAFLRDLGQVLYSVECVQRAEDQAGSSQQADSSSNSGPSSSWGGIVSSLASQHASDPDTLSRVLYLSGGLLEYAQDEGLEHTASLISDSMSQLQQRLEQLQGAATETSAAHGNTVTSAGQALNLAPRDAHATAGVASTATASNSAQLAGKVQPQVNASLRQRHVKGGTKAVQQVPSLGPATAAADDTKQSHQHSAPDSSALPGSTFKQCARYALLGFGSPALERQYKQWTAVRSRALTISHSLLITMWVIVSILRSAADGWEDLRAHLPVYLLCMIPYVVTTVLTVRRQHRWHQVSLVGHALGRTLANTGVALGVLAMPPTYSAMCKIKLGLWGEVLLHPLSEALCFPALLFAHAILAVFDIALLHICALTAPVFLAQALGLRACALAVGLGTDMGRRFAFIQQQQKLKKKQAMLQEQVLAPAKHA